MFLGPRCKEQIQARAKLFTDIRSFFAARNVLEVETPLLSQHTVTDIHIESFKTVYVNGADSQNYYLQTSPEYAMKRLLAAGSGPIYQISKAFRNGECGRQHNPEFTLLEWYRTGFCDRELMHEVDEFLQFTLKTSPAKWITYQQIFLQYVHLDPYFCELSDLQKTAEKLGFNKNSTTNDRDTLLQFLFSHAIEPHIGFEMPIIVHDFPASQAALAKICDGNPPVAERFEVYIQGMELANGFHELTDFQEQQRRFENDQKQRQQLNLPSVEIDQRFIAALKSGLPPCAGVALGVDRLLMLKIGSRHIRDVIYFPWEEA